ncbi:hypothetical protein SNE40_010232 [Patella caerulea]|uniref:Hint domain-containing protein n=1 Tax=Patella caerulea TaxID=87958 RepID=A0AAN8PSM0_PATCE
MGNDPFRRYDDDDWCCGLNCFPADAKVETKTHTKYVKELEVGDQVKVILEDGTIDFSEIWVMAHDDPSSTATYLILSTSKHTLPISHRHFVPVTDEKNSSNFEYKMAADIKVGDYLSTTNEENQPTTEMVIEIEEGERKGVFAPLTKNGYILVNGVQASVYAEVKPALAHPALAGLREKYDVTPKAEMKAFLEPNENGVPKVFDEAFKMLRQLMP